MNIRVYFFFISFHFRNLLFDTSDEQIRKFFQRFGAVESALAVRDSRTRLCRGSAFVCFESAESARACLEAFARRRQQQQQRYYHSSSQTEGAREEDASPKSGDDTDADANRFRIGEREVFVCAALTRERLAELRREREAGLATSSTSPEEGHENDTESLGLEDSSRRRPNQKPKHRDVRNMSLSLVGGMYCTCNIHEMFDL